MTVKNSFLVLCLILSWMGLLGGCAGLLDGRSFLSEMEGQNDRFFAPGQDFRLVSGDSGQTIRTPQEIVYRTPASGKTELQLRREESLKEELAQKEKRLSLRERERYFKVKDQLGSDSERIYYLDLYPQERTQYLQAKRPMISNRRGKSRYKRSTGRGLASLRPYHQRKGELFLGMSKNEVHRTWGRPGRIDIAGNPEYQNERWAFFVSGSVHYVFFEGGAVQGWQLD